MNEDLETIYRRLKDTYEYAKDVALITRDLNIQQGSNITKEVDTCHLKIKDCDNKLEMIDIIFRYIILNYAKEFYNKPIDLEYVFSKVEFKLSGAPKINHP